MRDVYVVSSRVGTYKIYNLTRMTHKHDGARCSRAYVENISNYYITGESYALIAGRPDEGSAG